MHRQSHRVGSVYTCIAAGMEVVDFSLYPDREYQLAWLRTFLELTQVERGRPGSDVSDVDVERLYVQVNKFSLVRLEGFLSRLFTTVAPLRAGFPLLTALLTLVTN